MGIHDVNNDGIATDDKCQPSVDVIKKLPEAGGGALVAAAAASAVGVGTFGAVAFAPVAAAGAVGYGLYRLIKHLRS